MAARSRNKGANAKPLSARKAGLEEDKALPVLDSIITMNAGGIIQSASDSVEDVFGWKPNELFGRNVNVLIPEPKRSSLDRYLDRYRKSDRSSSLHRTGRFAAVRKDGTNISIELSVSRADLPTHGTPYFIGIIRDVTRQIDVGGRDGDDRSRLQNLITQQTRALATANLRLQLTDRMASLGTLAAGLGHDMNNVLLPVRARLNALEHAGVAPSARAHLKAVRQSISYLQQLSDGLHLLALDPDGASAAQDRKSATSLSEWWAQMGLLLRKSIPGLIEVSVSIPASLPRVAISPHGLTQAVLNLMVNAGESIPKGRKAGKVRIHAVEGANGKCVRLSVSDNGRGMPQQVQRRAFDLFYTTKARGMGTGLGLPLARQVALRAGGDVALESAPGRGTKVTLELPIATEAITPAARGCNPPCTAIVSVGNRRLVATISHALAGAGVTVAPSGRRATRGADFWITEPTPTALTRAVTWKSRSEGRRVIVVGQPSRRLRSKWEALRAVIVEPEDEYDGLIHAIEVAVEGCARQTRKAESP